MKICKYPDFIEKRLSDDQIKEKVSRSSWFIRYVADPTEELQKIAVDKNIRVICVIKNLFISTIEAALEKGNLKEEYLEEWWSISIAHQEKLIHGNPLFASKIPKLDPGLKEKYKDLINAQNSGYM